MIDKYKLELQGWKPIPDSAFYPYGDTFGTQIFEYRKPFLFHLLYDPVGKVATFSKPGPFGRFFMPEEPDLPLGVDFIHPDDAPYTFPLYLEVQDVIRRRNQRRNIRNTIIGGLIASLAGILKVQGIPTLKKLTERPAVHETSTLVISTPVSPAATTIPVTKEPTLEPTEMLHLYPVRSVEIRDFPGWGAREGRVYPGQERQVLAQVTGIDGHEYFAIPGDDGPDDRDYVLKAYCNLFPTGQSVPRIEVTETPTLMDLIDEFSPSWITLSKDHGEFGLGWAQVSSTKTEVGHPVEFYEYPLVRLIGTETKCPATLGRYRGVKINVGDRQMGKVTYDEDMVSFVDTDTEKISGTQRPSCYALEFFTGMEKEELRYGEEVLCIDPLATDYFEVDLDPEQLRQIYMEKVFP